MSLRAKLDAEGVGQGTGLFSSAPDRELADHELDGVLSWDPDDSDLKEPQGQPRPRLLLMFANLAEQHPRKDLDFARRYGPLDLCTHNRPASHVASEVWAELGRPYEDRGGFDRDDLDFAEEFVDRREPPARTRGFPSALLSCKRRVFSPEPVSAWRRYARQASAMIDIRAGIVNGTLVSADRWEPLAEFDDDALPIGLPDMPQAPRHERLASNRVARAEKEFDEQSRRVKSEYRAALAWYVNCWLQLGGLRPVISGEAAGFRLSLVGHGSLFAALALQLADLMVSPGDPVVRCTWCGTLYEPRRKPRADQDNYCRSKRCQEARKKRWRSRQR